MQHIKVKDYLMEIIRDSKEHNNQKLPSENMLANKFNIPRKSVRDAYFYLEQMGMVESRQGVGHFIKPKRKPLNIVLTGDVSFSEKMKQQTKDYKSVLTRLEQIKLPNSCYQSITFEGSTTLFVVERLRYINGEPAAIHRSYVNGDLFPDIKRDRKQLTSIYQFYQKHGISQFESKFTNLSVTFPGKYERMMFQCENLVPLILVKSDNWDAKQNLQLEYTEILYRSDRFSFQLKNVEVTMNS